MLRCVRWWLIWVLFLLVMMLWLRLCWFSVFVVIFLIVLVWWWCLVNSCVFIFNGWVRVLCGRLMFLMVRMWSLLILKYMMLLVVI